MRKPSALLLSVLIPLLSLTPTSARVLRPIPAVNFSPIAANPAPAAAGLALQRFIAWLDTPAGAQVLSFDPGLAALKTLDLKSERGLLAVAPFVSSLPAGLLAQLKTIDSLAETERHITVLQVIEARRKASELVNTRAAMQVSGLAASVFQGRATPEQLEGFASHLEVFAWLGGGISEAAGFVRETASGLREALTHTQRVAEEIARRLEAMKPKVPILD